jgi:hypothetical protein
LARVGLWLCMIHYSARYGVSHGALLFADELAE